MNADRTGILIAAIALLGPVVTALVTAGGIALERRRSDRDLEARRLRLVEVARNQIAAVQPLSSWVEINGVSIPAEARERVHTIIISALDSILCAQALSLGEEQHRSSILSDLLLRRPFSNTKRESTESLILLCIRLGQRLPYRIGGDHC